MIAIAARDGAQRRELAELFEASGLNAAIVEGTAEEVAAGDVAKLDAGVLATDLVTPQGQEAMCAFVDALAPSPVTVVDTSEQREAHRSALDTGADGLVLVKHVHAALVPTVQATLAGQLCVPRSMRRRFATPPLSYREKQVLGLVVLGYTNAEIARTLFLAESTVKSHLSSSFDKLDVRSRKEATSLILDERHGLGTGILSISSPNGTRIGA